MHHRRAPLLPAAALFAMSLALAGQPAVPSPQGEEGSGTGRAIVERVRTEPSSFTFRVNTPPLETIAEERGVRVRLEGFSGNPRVEGAPDLPLRTFLVAIPEGATPRLSVSPQGEAWRTALLPVPSGGFERRWAPPSISGNGEEHERIDKPLRRRVEPDRAIYAQPGFFPQELASLGRIGWMRDQRYVEVNVTPVRWDGSAQALAVQPALDITVHFDGVPPRTTREFASDPQFEGVYREAFVNYGQGRTFRARIERTTPTVIAESAAGLGGGPRYRLRVRENGMLRLDHAFLLAQAPELLAHPTSRWRLTSQGVQVPLHVRQVPGGGSDLTLLDRSDEFVQFYGQAYDSEPVAMLVGNEGTGDELHAANDFTDENVYFLTVELAAQPAMPERAAAPGAEPLAGPSFLETVHVELDDRFLPWKGYDLWYWNPILSEQAPTRIDAIALPGLWSATAPFEVRVNVRGASDCLQHCSNPNDPGSCMPVLESHETGVRLRNGGNQLLELPANDPDNVGDVNLGEFPAKEGFTHTVSWVHAGGDPQLTSPLRVETQVFELPGDCSDFGGALNQVQNDVLLNWIEVDYQRELRATGDVLSFTWPEVASAVRFSVPGFTTSDVEVYEIGDFGGSSYVREAVRLTGVQVTPDTGQFTVSFRLDPDPGIALGVPRRFILVGNGAVAVPPPADFARDRLSTLASDDTQADLVVIAHPSLIESTCSIGGASCETDGDCADPGATCELEPSSSLAQYLALREAQGITTRLARLPDVQDEFNHGLAGPLAIENFLTFALNGGWQPPAPAYVLLLGDGSFDYKGGEAQGDFVPTQIVTVTEAAIAFFASDSVLADVVGADRIPDAVVGRLPARNLAEADAMLDRLVAYASAPIGSWRKNALFVSDRGRTLADADEAVAFEGMNQLAISEMVPPYTIQNLRYWSDNCVPGHPTQLTCDPAAMKNAIKGAVNGTLSGSVDGAAVMQYTGHGNFDLWSNDVIFCAEDGLQVCASHDDTEDLANQTRLPWLVAHNCLSGGFHPTDAKTFGERWMKAGGGGAIAVYAPSGVGFAFLGVNVVDDLWGPLFGPAKERQIAVPIQQHLVQQCSGPNPTENCQFYVLLGDPSLRLALHEVDRPEALDAAAGNGEVSLDWQPSATAGVEYDVYRERTLIPGYSLIANDLTGTSFLDTTAVNALEYHYYVVAQDAEGFESAWSNFNSDCELDGPDCVEARPLNPLAPVKPTGLTVEDREVGGSLRVSWTPNPEGDVDFYTLHHGPTPALGQTMVLGPPGPLDGVTPTPEALLFGLPDGEPYYVAVTATNTSGLTSVISDLAEGTPHLVLGVKAPDTIRDLRLSRSGEDLVLTWGAVTRDIYGKPLVTGSYEVFRSTDLHFAPEASNRIATVLAPTHSDPGQFQPGGPDEYYLVRALDLDGNPGGAGRQLPDGIRTLELDFGKAPGQLELSWPAVSEDFDHQPTVITHYELWTSEQPVSRQAIEDGTATLVEGAITGTSITVPLEPDEPRYYSVLAVDVRGNRSPF